MKEVVVEWFPMCSLQINNHLPPIYCTLDKAKKVRNPPEEYLSAKEEISGKGLYSVLSKRSCKIQG